jgi:hypothetical protein
MSDGEVTSLALRSQAPESRHEQWSAASPARRADQARAEETRGAAGMKLTDLESEVLDALRAAHIGRENGVGGNALAARVNLPNRVLRKTIESLIKAHCVPIGGDPVHGYYIIANEAEFMAARHELTTRLVALGERLRALDTAFRQDVAQPRQPKLFEESPPACA